MLSRRSFLNGLATAAVAACPVCRNAAAAEGMPWTYGASESWGDLSPEFRACGAGAEQSPVDLVKPIPSALGDVAIEWQAAAGIVANNGHTIEIKTAPGSAAMVAGERYELVQFHFHHPSEHALDGKRFAMEAHFVHRSAEGGLAVIGVFMVPGTENATLAKVWKKVLPQEGEAELDGAIDLMTLLPTSRAYYRYAGSLTTPPCSETVLWTVFADPVEISETQIAAFAAIYPMNARPLQNMNRRFLLGSF